MTYHWIYRSLPKKQNLQTSGKVNWSEVILFNLIAYTLAWLCWVPFLMKGMDGPRAFPGPYGFANGMFAPMGSAGITGCVLPLAIIVLRYTVFKRRAA